MPSPTRTSLAVAATFALLSSGAAGNPDIRHYSARNCPANTGYAQCTAVNEKTCCKDSRSFGFDSTSFSALQPTDIAAVYEFTNGKPCGNIRDSQIGPVPCLSPAAVNGLDGAAWFDCITCIGSAIGRDESSADEPAPLAVPDEYAVGTESKCTSWVEIDKLVLADGHMFDVGKDMPAEIKSELRAHTFGGSTIDMLHQDLLAHEVDHEGVEMRARENGFHPA